MEVSDSRISSRSKSSTTRKRTVSTRGNAKNRFSNVTADLRARIEVNAYYKAQARGFAPGYELEDWLAAEKEENNR